jgi:PAS domain-containing protein
MELGQRVYLDNVEDTPMFFTNKNGDFEWVNKAYLNLVQKPLSEILGTNWACCVIQDDREKVENEWKNTADAHRNFDMTYRFLDDNGNITKVHGRAWGNSSGYVGIVKKLEK